MKKLVFIFIATTSFSLWSPAQQRLNQDSLDRMEAAKTEIRGPEPPVVTPGHSVNQAPSDAIVLFNGKDLGQWRSTNNPERPAGWKLGKGFFTVDKKHGNIETKQSFLDFQLHLEWNIPKRIHGSDQGRGNSGVFLASTGKGDAGYEIQILDNYQNKTYVNGQAGSVYKQYIPLANACKKPGEWQSYDISWTAPRFHTDGTLASPARVTVFHNGVLIQNNVALKGETVWIGQPSYKKHGAAPIKLQSHGDPSEPISFRNIWVRPL